MPTAGIKVYFIGKAWNVPYEVRVCNRIASLMSDVAQFVPDVIVSSDFIPGALNVADFELRKRWIHVKSGATDEEVINAVESCYASLLWAEHPNQKTNPLVTVYTGSYNTGDFLRDTYVSLKEQSYTNWEWSVVDDESTDGTWEKLMEIASEDHRVHPVRIKHSGKIGAVKDIATRLANGVYLVELDHDDMLTDNCLAEVRKAFDENPEVGFVYSNCASFFQDGKPHQFTDDFWKTRYRETVYRGKTYLECMNPDIYDRFGPNHFQQFGWFLTVGPNHLRAYRASELKRLGGYNRNLPIADDWDVYARFFLYSKCLHLDRMLYLYRFLDSWSNTTFTRNKSIQDHLALGRRNYEKEFIDFNTKRMNQSQKKSVTESFKKGISAVILDWNTEEHTQKCIDSLKKCYPDVEVVLVQNGKHFDCLKADKVIQLEMNIGFSAGVNRGVMETSNELLLLLNSDTVVEEGLLEKLEKELVENPYVGVVGPYSNEAKYPQGNIEKHVIRPTHDLETLSGFCMLMRKQSFEEIGGFDTRLTTFEDDDFCFKMRHYLGLKCRVIGGAWLYHEGHSSFKENQLDVFEVMKENKRKYREKRSHVRVIALTYNEKKALPEFIEQFKSITNDFCFLDNGSDDGTVEWLRQQNGNGLSVSVIVEEGKIESYSQRRNMALDIFRDDSVGWIVMIDPDERLDTNTLRHFWEMFQAPYDIYYAPLWSRNYDGSETEWVAKPFLFRSKPEIRWVFPVHEKLIGSHAQALIMNARNTHILELHSKERRHQKAREYGDKDAPLNHPDAKGFPVLNYEHRDDERIKKVYLGPLISVVVPTYNRKELLEKALASIEKQDYLAIDTVVVGDNCPTLESAERRFNLPKNHGAGGAVPRNYAIMLAAGQWIAYLDDDNEWQPNHLSSLMQIAQANDVEFVVSSMSVDGKPLIFEQPAFGKVDTSCLLHRKSLIQRFGWWKDRNEGGYCHDWEFVKRWLDAGVRWAVTHLPTVIYNAETSGQKEFLERMINEQHV